MALDPSIIEAVKELGYWIGASLLGAGGAVGGTKVMERRKRGSDEAAQSVFCSDHHRCFEEIKAEIKEQGKLITEHGRDVSAIATDVAYIRGVIDRGLK